MAENQALRLTRAREELKIGTQTEASRLSGVPQKDISLMEKGEKKPILKYLLWLHSMGIDMNWFYSGYGDPLIGDKTAIALHGISSIEKKSIEEKKELLIAIEVAIKKKRSEISALREIQDELTEAIEKGDKTKKRK